MHWFVYKQCCEENTPIIYRLDKFRTKSFWLSLIAVSPIPEIKSNMESMKDIFTLGQESIMKRKLKSNIFFGLPKQGGARQNSLLNLQRKVFLLLSRHWNPYRCSQCFIQTVRHCDSQILGFDKPYGKRASVYSFGRDQRLSVYYGYIILYI